MENANQYILPCKLYSNLHSVSGADRVMALQISEQVMNFLTRLSTTSFSMELI
jgi:hypothetical protein